MTAGFDAFFQSGSQGRLPYAYQARLRKMRVATTRGHGGRFSLSTAQYA
jgi:hypothetical protein